MANHAYSLSHFPSKSYIPKLQGVPTDGNVDSLLRGERIMPVAHGPLNNYLKIFRMLDALPLEVDPAANCLGMPGISQVHSNIQHVLK